MLFLRVLNTRGFGAGELRIALSQMNLSVILLSRAFLHTVQVLNFFFSCFFFPHKNHYLKMFLPHLRAITANILPWRHILM